MIDRWFSTRPWAQIAVFLLLVWMVHTAWTIEIIPAIWRGLTGGGQ